MMDRSKEETKKGKIEKEEDPFRIKEGNICLPLHISVEVLKCWH